MIPPNTYTSPTHVTTQYIHESCSCYHPIHTRVLLMLPPNTYTSPAHDATQYRVPLDTTQYIHESRSCYHLIHTRVPLMLPPNTYRVTLDTTQYIHESCSCSWLGISTSLKVAGKFNITSHGFIICDKENPIISWYLQEFIKTYL